MPRKVNYGIDYDDGEYDDYDEEYEEYEEDRYDDAGERREPKQEISRSRLWRCSICTYDNEEDLSACDICGVLRNPVVNHSNGDKKTAGDACKDCGVSVMAKSLFASLPHRSPQKAVVCQQKNDDSLTEGGYNFYKHGNFKGNSHEYDKAFSSHIHSQVNIVPFKFDVPSPDDLVSHGLRSSKMGSKANINSKTPMSAKAGTVSAQSVSSSSGGSSQSFSKGKQLNIDATNYSSIGLVPTDSIFRNADSSSAAISNRGHSFLENSDFSKNSTQAVQSTDDVSDASSALRKGKGQSVKNTNSSLSGGSSDMSLSDKFRNSVKIFPRRVKSSAQYQPDKWMLPDKADDALIQLNLAIVGHVDSGKSTLCGRLLHLLGRISPKEMHKYEKEAKIQGKGSFAYAWALDESPEERERGITMTVAVAYFDTKRYNVVVLDSPGHKDFVPNMISGATQADAAILVIDALTGAFEAGIDVTKGQTREHAQLIRSFGVDQIIIAVNKMDTVEYSKDRFDFIKAQLGTFLRSCGFKDSSISWIPLSVMENQNLVQVRSDHRFSWYQGPHLLDAIDSFQLPARDFSKPFLMPICDVVKSSSQGQLVSACGKLEAGALKSGLKVLVMPSGNLETVRKLERDSRACAVARAGDNVTVSLTGIDGNQVMAGDVLCHPEYPVAVAKRLELKVLVLEITSPILIGSQLEFHIHHAKETAKIDKIVSLLDPKTGKATNRKARWLTAKQTAVIEVTLDGPVCVEEFSSCRALGRASLRASGRTVGVGIVTRVFEEQE